LSGQPLLACDTNFTLGCDGGYISRSFDYAKRHGLVSTTCLPFDPTDSNIFICNQLVKPENCDKLKLCERFKIAE
jgi:hypothetical protein